MKFFEILKRKMKEKCLFFVLIFFLMILLLNINIFIKFNKKEKIEKNLIKIVCWLPCLEKDIETILEIKKGWGSFCTEFLLFSNFQNSSLNSIDISQQMNLKRKEVYGDLALKVWHSWKTLFKKYKDQKDFFFLKADPDTYIIMQNYLELLSQYDPYKPKTSFYF